MEQNVNFEKSEVLIYGRKTKEYRTVPVTSAFLKKLEEMRTKAQSDYIVEYKGRAIKYPQHAFRKASLKAGITYNVTVWAAPKSWIFIGTPVRFQAPCLGPR